MRAKPPLSGNTIRQEDFNEKANNDRRFAEDFSAAYQADYYQELNVNEIAVALGISHSSVSGRLKRGREKPKKLLEGREIDEWQDKC